jgi:hypothetical protein
MGKGGMRGGWKGKNGRYNVRHGEEVRWDRKPVNVCVEEGGQVEGQVKRAFGELREEYVSSLTDRKRTSSDRFCSYIFKQVESTINGYRIVV